MLNEPIDMASFGVILVNISEDETLETKCRGDTCSCNNARLIFMNGISVVYMCLYACAGTDDVLSPCHVALCACLSISMS
jgi:hypothetical protein